MKIKQIIHEENETIIIYDSPTLEDCKYWDICKNCRDEEGPCPIVYDKNYFENS